MRETLTSKNLVETVKDKIQIYAACLLTFVLAATIKGDWLFIAVNIGRQFSLFPNEFDEDPLINDTRPYLEQIKLQNVHIFVSLATTVSFSIFFGLGGWFQYTYYIKRRDKPEEWKCQPERYMTPEIERSEIMLGTLNMLIGSIGSGTLACYIMNGGQTKMYFDPLEYGLPYLLLSFPAFYLLVDGLSFYTHAAFHWPFLYKLVHKYHHKYYSPTAFGAVAMHPLEFMMYQLMLFCPIFFIPLHAGICIFTALYIYYYGMVDHSGVMMDAIWPWQPESKFHDDHHKYFHVNFGFNSKLFDWLHDTLRKEDREYGEDVFYGRGRQRVAKTKNN